MNKLKGELNTARKMEPYGLTEVEEKHKFHGISREYFVYYFERV